MSGRKRAERRRVDRADGEDQITERAGLERPLPRQALVEHHAQRVDVALGVDGARPAQLLEAHVIRRPDGRARARERVVQLRGRHLHDPEVEDRDEREVVGRLAFRPRDLGVGVGRIGQVHVVGLQVPMNEADAVGLVEPFGDLDGQVRDERQRQAHLRLEHVAQVSPDEQRHHHERPGVAVAELHHLHDVSRAELREGPRLLLEPRGLRRIEQRLEREPLARAVVLDLVHDARPAHADHAHDPVAAVDQRAGGELGRVGRLDERLVRGGVGHREARASLPSRARLEYPDSWNYGPPLRWPKVIEAQRARAAPRSWRWSP
jgi:hypothetical protein